ncbi:MAG: hypothetical protein WBC88_05705, partial [Candidatus Zixiibacteriota bacterium]
MLSWLRKNRVVTAFSFCLSPGVASYRIPATLEQGDADCSSTASHVATAAGNVGAEEHKGNIAQHAEKHAN